MRHKNIIGKRQTYLRTKLSAIKVSEESERNHSTILDLKESVNGKDKLNSVENTRDSIDTCNMQNKNSISFMHSSDGTDFDKNSAVHTSMAELNNRFSLHRNIPVPTHLAVKVIEIPAIDIFGIHKSKIHNFSHKAKKGKTVRPNIIHNSVNASFSTVDDNIRKINISQGSQEFVGNTLYGNTL